MHSSSECKNEELAILVKNAQDRDAQPVRFTSYIVFVVRLQRNSKPLYLFSLRLQPAITTSYHRGQLDQLQNQWVGLTWSRYVNVQITDQVFRLSGVVKASLTTAEWCASVNNCLPSHISVFTCVPCQTHCGNREPYSHRKACPLL